MVQDQLHIWSPHIPVPLGLFHRKQELCRWYVSRSVVSGCFHGSCLFFVFLGFVQVCFSCVHCFYLAPVLCSVSSHLVLVIKTLLCLLQFCLLRLPCLVHFTSAPPFSPVIRPCQFSTWSFFVSPSIHSCSPSLSFLSPINLLASCHFYEIIFRLHFPDSLSCFSAVPFAFYFTIFTTSHLLRSAFLVLLLLLHVMERISSR